MSPKRLLHGRVELALHCLRSGEAPRLLLLHELGGCAPTEIPEEVQAWPGSIWSLDFTGHGESSVPAGGGYTAEMLMADADIALAEIGPATVLGYGLGAYVALLLAGSRPELVRGTVLCPGAGLSGGGPEPPEVGSIAARPPSGDPPDPHALAELSRDVRPPKYAGLYVRQAAHRSKADPPVTVASEITKPFPPWLAAILEETSVAEAPVAEALARYGVG